jgi:hypothetical protein
MLNTFVAGMLAASEGNSPNVTSLPLVTGQNDLRHRKSANPRRTAPKQSGTHQKLGKHARGNVPILSASILLNNTGCWAGPFPMLFKLPLLT